MRRCSFLRCVAVHSESLSLLLVSEFSDDLLRPVHCLFPHRGNVGFFIAMIDSIGYTGTVLVLLFKEMLQSGFGLAGVYNTMAGTVGIVCCTAFTLSLLYMIQRYRKGKRQGRGDG